MKIKFEKNKEGMRALRKVGMGKKKDSEKTTPKSISEGRGGLDLVGKKKKAENK